MKQGKDNFSSGHTIIAQLLSLIPREIFKEVTEQEGSDRYYKKLKSIDHFITMFYAVLTRNSSLREVCTNISFIAKSLIPFGIKQSLPEVHCPMQTENPVLPFSSSSIFDYISIIEQI